MDRNEQAMGITKQPIEGGHEDKRSQTEPMSPIEEEQFYSLEDTEPLTNIVSENPIEQTAPSPYVTQNEERNRTFRSWISTIGRGKKYRFARASGLPQGWPGNDISDCRNKRRRRESNVAEIGSITSASNLRMVRTASFDMQSLRTLPRPRSNTQNSNQRSMYGAISVAESDAKASTDDFRLPVDQKAWSRAVHRRGVIKEMIETETSYLASLKILADILSTVVLVQSGLHRSTQDLVCLHQSLLTDLQNINDHSSTSGPLTLIKTWSTRRRREKTDSPDSRPESPDRRSIAARKLCMPIEARMRSSRSLGAEPSEAAEAAEILDRKLPQFVAYADYSVKYHLAAGEIDGLRRTLTKPESIELGIEALMKMVATPENQKMFAKQGLTVSDLIMKPIQRVCKYQLFLADLLRSTPVTDCPTSHQTIDRVLQKVIEVVQRINRSSGDPVAQDLLRKTMRLQQKIQFCRQYSGDRDILQEFGSVKACGVLHISYQTPERVTGEYMMCALFSTHLLLGTLREDKGKISVVAMIRTADCDLGPANDKSGLHCEDAPLSWKIIFYRGCHVFELVATACSEKEATKWKEQLLKQINRKEEQHGRGLIPFLQRSRTFLDLKPKFTFPNGNRRPIISRSTSANAMGDAIPKAPIVNLIIKGTESAITRSISSINLVGRSQTVHTTYRPMAILTPKRHDRLRLEHRLASVWTKDVIPYPGMQTGRGEYVLRSSAESLIRRFTIRRPSFMNRKSSSSIQNVPVNSRDSQSLSEKDALELSLSLDGSLEDEKLVSIDVSKDGASMRSFMSRGSFPSHSLPMGRKQTLRKRLSMSLFKARPPPSSTPPPVPPIVK